VVLAVLAAVAVGFVVGRFWENSKKDPNRLVLYGNVDLREVELSFNNSERIAEVLVQEGDRVARGQILARLDTSRLKPQAAEAEAEVETQQAVVEKLHHGSRPEEIAQAQANVASTKADQVNAQEQWRRMTALAGLTTGRAISQQDLDGAKAALGMAQGRLDVAQKGPRSVRDRPKGGRHRPRGGATARHSSPTRSPAPEIGRRRTCFSVRCRGAIQALGAWRYGVPPKAGFRSGNCGSKVDQGLCFRVRSGKDSFGNESVDQRGQFSGPDPLGLGRFHFFGRRIHAKDCPDRGTALQPSL
jgi:multidrug efflux pump subunit AcrA (membrane-fusion protein)